MTQNEWNIIKKRDTAYNGVFFVGKKKNHTVCTPSCPAKLCEPKNIIIFSTLEEALLKGFHPCRRCRPDVKDWKGAKGELSQKAKAYIDAHLTDKFSLDKTADALFVNKYYLTRVFKESEGMTLLSYHNLARCKKAAALLERNEHNIAYISDTVGYATPSHFARSFKAYFGMSPSRYRKMYFDNFK